MSLMLAHGIGGVRGLPIPLYLFFYAVTGVLVVSFGALAFLWQQPVLARRAEGRPLPAGLESVLLSRTLRVAAGAATFALLLFLWLGALLGTDDGGLNLTPTFVYVYFWVGIPILSVLLGNVWTVLDPWRAAAEGVGWAARRLGLRHAAPLAYPAWLGRWPAAVLLLAYATME